MGKHHLVESGHLPQGWLKALRDPALAIEFRRAPFGPHSDALQRLLTVMQQTQPVAGKPIYLTTPSGETWLLEVPSHPRHRLIPRLGPATERTTEELEIEAFGLRWKALFGEELPA
jgi:hypothetical protein